MIKKYVKVVIFIKMYICMQHLAPPKPSVCCGFFPPQDGARFPFISLDCMTSLVESCDLGETVVFCKHRECITDLLFMCCIPSCDGTYKFMALMYNVILTALSSLFTDSLQECNNIELLE